MAKATLAKLERHIYGEPDKLWGHIDAAGYGYVATHPASHASDPAFAGTEGG